MTKDDRPESGYEPQGQAPESAPSSREYIRAEDVLVQMNLTVPQTLKWAIEDYAAEHAITKRQALTELLQLALAQKRLRSRL